MERFNCFDRFSCLDTSDSNTYRYKNDPDGQASQIHKLYELLQNLNAEITGNKAKTGYFCLSWIDKYSHCHNYWWSYRDVTKKHFRYNHLYWIESNNLDDLIGLVNKYPLRSWYITPNTFKTKSRSEYRFYNDNKINRKLNQVGKEYNNINTILAFYLDFDVVKTFKDDTEIKFYYPNGHIRKIMGTRTMMKPFLDNLQDLLIYCGFEDNVIIKSGNGYHALIILKHGIYCGSDNINHKWHKSEENMVSKVSHACASDKFFGKSPVDPKVSNIGRILRVAGSFNLKHLHYKPRAKYWINTKTKLPENPRPVRLEYFDPDNRPDFWQLYSYWVFGHTCYHYDKAKIERERKTSKCGKSIKIKKNPHKEQQYRSYQTRKHNKTGNGVRSLNYCRCRDIWDHVTNERKQYKNGNHDPKLIKDHRELTLFYYSTSNVWIWSSNSKVAKNIMALNKRFIRPLSNHYIQTGVITEIPKTRAKIHKPQASKYHPSNSTLINDLNITKQEQKHMRTVINSTERQKRYKQRLLKRKYNRKAKQDELNVKMFRLHEAGKSYQVIADTFGKSRSTAIRRVRLGKSASVKYRTLRISKSSHYDSVKESKHKVSVSRNKSDVDVSDLHRPNDPIYQQELKLNEILKYKRKRMLGDG